MAHCHEMKAGEVYVCASCGLETTGRELVRRHGRLLVHRAGLVLRPAALAQGVGRRGARGEPGRPYLGARRARSSALRTRSSDQGRVWFVDPTDDPAALERALALGSPAAVVQLLDRHNRDCAALAARLDVPHLRVPAALPGTPFEVVPVVSAGFWREVALWWAEARVLVVAEAIGTAATYAPGPQGAGVSIGLRLWPPRRLAAYRARASARRPWARAARSAGDGRAARGPRPLAARPAAGARRAAASVRRRAPRAAGVRAPC